MRINGTLQVDGTITGTSTTQAPGDNSTKLATTAYADAAGGGSLEVKEIDGAPDVSPVTVIQVTNGKLTDNGGGNITLDLSGSGSTPHDLLDGSVDQDTLAGTVVRGDLIVGNATPKWARKAIGAVNTVLVSDGTDTQWDVSPRIDTIYYEGRIIPTSISANTNDYNPIDSGSSQSFHDVMHISVAATAAWDVTGFDEGGTGEPKVFTNRGTFTITFKHASGSSSANNQIWCPGAADYAVTAKMSVYMYYSQPDNKWLVVGSAAGSGITALTGDVTASGSGSVAATIANSAVTLAKIANAAASSKLVGSGSSGSGAAYSEITLGSNLSMSGTTLSASSDATTAVQKARVVLTDSQIKTLNSVPVQLVAAPGSGKIITIYSIMSQKDASGGAYSASSTVTFAYGTTQNIQTWAAQLATADRRWQWGCPVLTTNTGDIRNKAIMMSIGADVTGGNAANFIAVEVTYSIFVDGP